MRQGLSDGIKKDNQDGKKREIRGSKGEDDEDNIWHDPVWAYTQDRYVTTHRWLLPTHTDTGQRTSTFVLVLHS